MMKASNLAGKAINISRTTAAHALSYKITSEYGIPHGHAVALSIPDVFYANKDIDDSTCVDERGREFVINRLNEINDILNINNIQKYWINLMKQIGLKYNFEKLGIVDKQLIINSVNQERLKNNPKILSNDLCYFWRNIWETKIINLP